MPGSSLLTSLSLYRHDTVCKEREAKRRYPYPTRAEPSKRGTDDDEVVLCAGVFISTLYPHLECPDRVSNRSFFVSATSGRQWNSRLGPRATTTSRTSCDAQLDLRLAPLEENIDFAAGPEYHLHSLASTRGSGSPSLACLSL